MFKFSQYKSILGNIECTRLKPIVLKPHPWSQNPSIKYISVAFRMDYEGPITTAGIYVYGLPRQEDNKYILKETGNLVLFIFAPLWWIVIHEISI